MRLHSQKGQGILMNDETRPEDPKESGKVVALDNKKAAIEAKQSALSKHLQAIRARSGIKQN